MGKASCTSHSSVQEREREKERWISVVKQHSLISELKVSDRCCLIKTRYRIWRMRLNVVICHPQAHMCTCRDTHKHTHAYKGCTMVANGVLWQENGRPNQLHMLKCIRHLWSSDGFNLFISTFILKYRKTWEEASIPVHGKAWLYRHHLKYPNPINIWKTKLPLLCEWFLKSVSLLYLMDGAY